MLNMMQNFQFDFLEDEFWADWCLSFQIHFQTLHNILAGFCSMYRGILELKNDTSILQKNGSFAKVSI